MIVSGVVVNVRDGNYVNQRTKEQISMLYIDLADDTVSGVVQTSLQLKDAAFRPEKLQKISADVSGYRPVSFGGGGVNFTIKNLRVVGNGANGDGAGVIPPAPPSSRR